MGAGETALVLWHSGYGLLGATMRERQLLTHWFVMGHLNVRNLLELRSACS